MNNAISKLISLLKKTEKRTGSDYMATVTRVEGGTAYVQLSGADIADTPVAMTINAKKGDTVRVRVNNGQAWLVGNDDRPPTDDYTAIQARSTAESAGEVAGTAYQAASDAQTSAALAAQAADLAQNALKSVVAGAITVEKAVSVMQTAMEAVLDYDPATDTTKEYFWHDANGAHVLGTDGTYRNDIASEGMKIVETASEESVAEFGANGVTIGKTGSAQLVEGADGIQLTNEKGSDVFDMGLLSERVYSNKIDTFKYSNESPFAVEFPWTFYSDSNISYHFFTSSGTEITGLTTTGHITIGGDTLTIDSTLCTEMISANCAYFSVMYHARGKFPYYTAGTRGAGYTAPFSFAAGENNIGNGVDCAVFGDSNRAEGSSSFVAGYSNIAYGHNQAVIGQYNTPIQIYTNAPMLIVGNGTSDSNRSNALVLDFDGNLEISGGIMASNLKSGKNYECCTEVLGRFYQVTCQRTNKTLMVQFDIMGVSASANTLTTLFTIDSSYFGITDGVCICNALAHIPSSASGAPASSPTAAVSVADTSDDSDLEVKLITSAAISSEWVRGMMLIAIK